MSGSPPLPPKPHREAVFREQRPFQASRQDVYGTDSAAAAPPHITSQPQYNQLPPIQAGARPPPFHERERHPASYSQLEDPSASRQPYSPQAYRSNPDSRYSILPTASSNSLMGSTFPPSASQHPGSQGGAGGTTPLSSPKSQRKTKGHVASACVPCKRAHLRCDAQRPCSRCLSNGKDDACVDVQHKKRGRPRLRDDREARFEPARYSHHDESLSRRSSLYSPAASTSASYEESLRRSQSYRVIKSQPNEPDTSGYAGHERPGGVQAYPHNPPHVDRGQDAVALLTLDLAIVNASERFFEMLGSRDILGLRMLEIVSPHERDRIAALQSSLHMEQNQREPNYLPPIFMREETDRVIRSIPFAGDSLSRFRLDRLETITFKTADEQLKPVVTRIGLAKEGSIYFVILRPELASPHSHGTSQSLGVRDFSHAHQPGTQPIINSYDSGREGGIRPAPESGHGQPHFGNPRPGLPSLNQGPIGLSQSGRPYSSSPAPRIESMPTTPSVQIPRSELAAHHSQIHEYQLPPIRSAPQPDSRNPPSWQRDERFSRVDIGRIIDGPAPTRRP